MAHAMGSVHGQGQSLEGSPAPSGRRLAGNLRAVSARGSLPAPFIAREDPAHAVSILGAGRRSPQALWETLLKSCCPRRKRCVLTAACSVLNRFLGSSSNWFICNELKNLAQVKPAFCPKYHLGKGRISTAEAACPARPTSAGLEGSRRRRVNESGWGACRWVAAAPAGRRGRCGCAPSPW